MPDFELNEEQQAILAHDLGLHARILAGPGTGKSVTLVALLDNLLKSNQKLRIRLLTFTRATTVELAKKVLEHEVETAERPSTIHSFAISVLLRNPGAGGLPQPLRFADDWEYKNVIRPSLAARAVVPVPVLDKLVREMAANWQSLRQDLDSEIDERTRTLFLGVWGEHRQVFGYTLLQELPYALRAALRDHPDLAGVDYAALIVDEYQDLNACDLEILKRIAERGCAIVGAGDDDQSIYSFRKAAPQGILRFLEDYPGAADYPLSVSHRCGRRIVAWASYVVQGDPDRPRDKPPLTSAEGCPEGEVALLSFPGHVAEARGIARLVKGLVDRDRVSPSEILIILRSDRHAFFSNPIKHELETLEIPYSDPDAVDRVLAEPGNRQLLALCRLMTRQVDSLAWATLLHQEQGIGQAFAKYVYRFAREQHSQFGDALLDAYGKNFPGGSGTPLAKARELVARVLAWLESHQAPEEQPAAGWGHWIIELVDQDSELTLTDELQELLVTVDEVAEPGQDLARYLGQLSPVGRDLLLAQRKGVRIMTMTGAKGLTVRAAIIAALEDGIVPRPDSDLGEERRLLYVAMTRAKEVLYLTWARRRRGPTARTGTAAVGQRRRHSHFLNNGPVESEDGGAFVRSRFG